ncbi:Fe(3+)-siderophore ABC transporter permease [Vibrio atypicus]|uniref:Fe(3+)-siderophore ABC transporter permease n=1 Tax=Vibrio atypicus TaxID=558271 RepID=UPI001CEDA190|nr:Fe(3+)-siderophore ABC transporter permease [Vibrio atypicus]
MTNLNLPSSAIKTRLKSANTSSCSPSAKSAHTIKLLTLFVLLLVVCFASLFIGAKSISMTTVMQAVIGNVQSTEAQIVLESRLPRALVGLIVGAALAVAGCLIQSITRNPLADPGILGVNSGASFCVLAGIIWVGNQSIAEHLWFAFFGAMITSIFVYFIGTYKEARVNPLKLTLAGVAIGALLAGISSTITLMSPMAFDQMRFWDAGSLDVRNIGLISFVTPPIVLGLLAALIISPSLDNLALGEDVAQGLGTNVRIIQLTALVSIALLCGSATAIAGPIGFIGLMIPHIARRLSGPNQLWLSLYSICLGPLLLISADIIGRVIATNEIRVSIVTAFVGAPVLIYLARKVTSFGKL